MRSMASSASPKGIAAIVGVGPNLGRSIARKFAHEGYTVAILARDLGQESPSIRDPDRLLRVQEHQGGVRGVLSLGFVEVLVYNAHHPPSWSPTSFADIRLDHFDKSLAVAAVGAFHCAQQDVTVKRLREVRNESIITMPGDWGRTAWQKRGRVDGPRRGGSDLLASAHPGPIGLDSGDRRSPQQQQQQQQLPF
ncbi:UNVERIFIED_CONTAM: hypothetical protein Sradi_0994600 [Sesamum radiatum]|uniref:Uncharacterized protein n=1 Tax=Sesamum radiatum TaxID=300843 RepID=A0AAW2V6B5_SESRA